jgi:hypothetical protein
VHKEDYGQGTGLSEDRERELRQKYIVASSALNKATDIGAFYISQKPVSCHGLFRDIGSGHP